MIGTRSATALAFLLSIIAVALGVTALAVSLRDEDDAAADLLQTRIDRVDGDPIPFPLHEFYLSGDPQGVPRALYMYPPGYFGHVRGCKVLWLRDDAVQVGEQVIGPGLFVDPCGGARFDREGRLIAGPADRGLDRFATSTEIGGAIVHLESLQCGPAGRNDIPVVPALTATPPPSPPLPAAPRSAPSSATPTASATATASMTGTPTSAATPPVAECERVEKPG